jgi:hypothetical protein
MTLFTSRVTGSSDFSYICCSKHQFHAGTDEWRPFGTYIKSIHTYRSRFIPEGVASRIFLQDVLVLPKLLSYKEYYMTGGKPSAVW